MSSTKANLYTRIHFKWKVFYGIIYLSWKTAGN